jgi:hypothetical protein
VEIFPELSQQLVCISTKLSPETCLAPVSPVLSCMGGDNFGEMLSRISSSGSAGWKGARGSCGMVPSCAGRGAMGEGEPPHDVLHFTRSSSVACCKQTTATSAAAPAAPRWRPGRVAHSTPLGCDGQLLFCEGCTPGERRRGARRAERGSASAAPRGGGGSGAQRSAAGGASVEGHHTPRREERSEASTRARRGARLSGRAALRLRLLVAVLALLATAPASP